MGRSSSANFLMSSQISNNYDFDPLVIGFAEHPSALESEINRREHVKTILKNGSGAGGFRQFKTEWTQTAQYFPVKWGRQMKSNKRQMALSSRCGATWGPFVITQSWCKR
jgi:hypothetical protein